MISHVTAVRALDYLDFYEGRAKALKYSARSGHESALSVQMWQVKITERKRLYWTYQIRRNALERRT